MPFNIGPGELILLAVVALLLFGPRRLPEIGKSVGEGIASFKRAMNSMTEIPTPSPARPAPAASAPALPAAAPAPAAPAPAAVEADPAPEGSVGMATPAAPPADEAPAETTPV